MPFPCRRLFKSISGCCNIRHHEGPKPGFLREGCNIIAEKWRSLRSAERQQEVFNEVSGPPFPWQNASGATAPLYYVYSISTQSHRIAP